MTREIKFRGKRIDNGEWVCGENYAKVKNLFAEGDLVVINSITVNPETVGQFTGLTDRNGKEIYEGHIVQYKTIANDCVGNIRCGKYEQDGSGGEYSSTTCLGFYIQRNRIIPTAWDIECGGPWARDEDAQISPCKTEMEVIGSIYENPELLERSEQA